LAADGYHVVITGRDAATATSQAKELHDATGAPATGYAFDVRDFDAAARLVRQIVTECGRMDAVVVSAGVMLNAPLGMVASCRRQRG
jgi:NADP-dependent 3-hydroxy acid dehydrogenase YdfG